MRKVFVLSCMVLTAYAEQNTCTSIALFSLPYSKQEMLRLSQQTYPATTTCKVLQAGKMLTVRCGCYPSVKKAKKELTHIKQYYKNAIVTQTYAFHFQKQKIQKKTESVAPAIDTKAPPQDAEYVLMLQAFLYTNDLKNAYRVAKLAYDKTPNSYYWNKQLAQLSIWEGKDKETIKYLGFLYKHSHNQKILETLLQYSVGDYQYTSALRFILEEVKRDPSNKNINKLLYLYNMVGYPEKGAEVLTDQYKKNPKRTLYLTKALQIYLNTGDLQKAQKLVEIMEEKKLYTIRNVSQIAYYYYLRRQPDLAYKYLLLARPKATKEDIQYYRLLSDLGWYEQDFLTAAEASKILILQNKGTLGDYDRVAQIYRKSDPKFTMHALFNAYKKYKLPYLFYNYAYNAVDLRLWRKLRALIQIVDTDKTNPLHKDAQFWLIKAHVYASFEQTALAKEALLEADRLEPDSFEIQSTMLSLCQTYHFDTMLHQLLRKLSKRRLDARYYLPLASAYFYLQNVNRAVFYMHKAANTPFAKTVDYRFLLAYIYQSQGNKEAFYKEMQTILRTLSARVQSNPALQNSSTFWNNELSAAIYLDDAEKFKKKLHAAKRHLSASAYNDIAYSWAIRNRAYEKAHLLFKNIKNPELWMRFSEAVNADAHSKIENMLARHLTSLARLDASSAAQEDGQIALAQSLAYNAFQNSDDSQNAYSAHLSLVQDYASNLNLKISYYDRDPLLQKYTILQDQTYVYGGWYFLADFGYFKNSLTNTTAFGAIPSTSQEIGIGAKKIFPRGSVTLQVKNKNAVRSYNSYAIDLNYKFDPRIALEFSYNKNKTADENIPLLLGGKKESFDTQITYNLLNSTSLSFLYEHNRYTSQDNVSLGKGDYFRLGATTVLRQGYPDLSTTLFYDNGTYAATNASNNTVSNIAQSVNGIMPQNFYDIGATFNYGLNVVTYSKIWRPYFSASTYYNGQSGNLNYGIEAGYGGELFHQDHCVIGTSYSQSLNGVAGNIFELFIRYTYLNAGF